MAAEMLEKILGAEQEAKEKSVKTQTLAREIIDKATNEGKKIISDAKLRAENESKRIISECSENAKKLCQQRLAEAEKVCSEMSEKCLLKFDECTQIIIDKLIS